MRRSFEIEVEGEPRGKGRPKFSRRGKHVHVYTPAETVAAEAEFRDAWEAAGAIGLDGPIGVEVALIFERPQAHFLKDGLTLSAAGQRRPLPDNKKPDIDNALKLVLDGLNGAAWKDDVQVTFATVKRLWGNESATVVEAWEAIA